MRLKYKLLVLAFVPIVFLLFFSVRTTLEKTRQASEMSTLVEMAKGSAGIGALVHELQKERGMSAGFIGSKGASFSNELLAQHLVADKARVVFEKQLSGFLQSTLAARWEGPLREATQLLAELASKRQATTALGLSGPEVIAYYSKTIANLLAIVGQISSATGDTSVAQVATAYSALLQSKERAGIERATLSNVFAADQFSSEMLVRFLSVSAAQDTWLDVFRLYASAEQAAYFKSKMSGAIVDAVAKIKKSALDNMRSASLNTDAKEWFAASTKRIDLLKDVEDKLADELVAMAQTRQNEASVMMTITLGLTLLAIVLTLTIALKLIREILKQIGGEPDYAVRIARTIAQGDLSQTVVVAADDDSSLLAAMKEMQTGLREMIEKVIVATAQLVASAERLAVSSQQVMGATNRQSDAAAAVAATVEQMTVSIGHISDNASDVHSSALESKRMAQEGAKTAQETVVEMTRIVENVEQSSTVMRTLDEQSHKIAGIVGVIEEIANQTNLLALNAAIEAARAGEQGRGFAVVADEVRKLAERTKRSTEDVATMIAAVRSGTSQAVDSMSHGTVIVNEGMSLVGHTGESMTKIHDGTNEVLNAIDAITTSLREQSTASNDIARSVEGIAQMVETNSAAINDVAASAEQLRALSCELKESAARFQL